MENFLQWPCVASSTKCIEETTHKPRGAKQQAQASVQGDYPITSRDQGWQGFSKYSTNGTEKIPSNYIKLKFLFSKGKNRVNRWPIEWEKIMACYTSNKDLILRIYKEL